MISTLSRLIRSVVGFTVTCLQTNVQTLQDAVLNEVDSGTELDSQGEEETEDKEKKEEEKSEEDKKDE